LASAAQKRALMEKSALKQQFDLPSIRERAALRLRGGIFSGAGGWKDLLGVVASAGALAKFVSDFSSQIQRPAVFAAAHRRGCERWRSFRSRY
jgi:hypothetical protein